MSESIWAKSDACVCSAAFGAPVVPLVKMTRAPSFGVGSGLFVKSSRDAVSRSRGTSSMYLKARTGHNGPRSATLSSRLSVTKTISTRASRIACVSSPMGCEGDNGTAIHPSRHTASIAAQYSAPGSAITPTAFPLPLSSRLPPTSKPKAPAQSAALATAASFSSR